MAHEWKGAVVLVTGAANGIGAGVARLALQEGAKHVAILDVDETGLDFAEILNVEFGSGRAQFHRCDVTDDEQLYAAYGAVVKDHGALDVVINNAGILNDSPKMYRKEIAINFIAVVTSTLKAMELMRRDEGGSGGTIINISSTFALTQSPFIPIYRATKAAVLDFSNRIGNKESFLKTGVRVISVCFGGTATTLVAAKNIQVHDPVCWKLLKGESTYLQKAESAARGVHEAYRRGRSGSTWLAVRDQPALDISDDVSTAYQLLGEHD